MLGAAPRVSLFRAVFAAVAVASTLVAVPLASGAVTASAGGTASSSGIWAVAFPSAKQTQLSTGLFVRLKQAGVSTIVVQRSGWGPDAHKLLARYAGNNFTKLVEPVAAPKTTAQQAALRAHCTGKRTVIDRCAVTAANADGARAWLKRGTVDFVVLRLASVAGFVPSKWPATKKSKLLALVPLTGSPGKAWQDALAVPASANATLAASPSAVPGAGFNAYLGLLAGSLEGGKAAAGAGGPADTAPPTAPGNPRLVANTMSSLTILWTASTDDVGVAGYEIFLNGVSQTKTTNNVVTLNGLDCETWFTVGIEAYDAAGNHSPRASVDAMTQYGCFHPGGGGGGGDPTPPPAPTGLTMTSSTATAITLGWTAPAGSIAGYRVFQNSALLGTTGSTSYTFSGLTCNTTYTLAVSAYDGSGLSSPQTSGSFKTAACAAGSDTTPPTLPGPLSLGTVTSTSIAVSWSAATDNVGVTGYALYKNGVAAGTTTSLNTTFTGLTCGTSYTLGVEATDAANNHSTRVTLIATTSACADTIPPTPPTNLNTTAASATSISVSWTAATDNVGVTGYTLYRNNATVTTQAGTSYTYTGLTCGTSYTLSVDAFDAANNHSVKTNLTASTNACSGDTQAPTTPTNFAQTAATTTSISVSWTASTDNVAVTGYTLYRNGTQVTTQAGTTFSYTGLTCGTSYTLAVDAFDAAGNHSAKATITKSTNTCPGDTQAPTPPTNVQTSNVTQTSLTLSWTASTDNVAVTGYDVSVSGSSVGTTTSTSFNVSGLNCGTSYTLGVVAFDAAGNRSAQSTTSVSTTGCGAPPPGTANLWIDTNGGTCTRQASPGAYNDAQACSGLQAAANAASTGDLILIKDGTYPGEQLTGSKTLTFQGAGPGRPSFGQIMSGASNITVRHVLIQNRNYPAQTVCSFWDYTLYVCAPNQTYDDVIVDGMDKGKAQGDSSRLGAIEIDSNSTNFVFKNGEIKAIRDNKGIQGGADGMLIENNLIHDVGLTNAGQAAGVHLECAAVTEGANQVWRRNKFWDCSVINWVAQNYVGGPAFGPVTLENNVFAHPMLDDVNGSWQNGAPCLTIVGGNNGTNAVNNWVVRFNTFECDVMVDTPSNADDNHSAKWYGNLGTDPGCGAPEWTMSYNVGNVCGSSTGSVVVANGLNSSGSPNVAPFYVNAPGFDFHLKAGANAAVNVGAPTFPSVDLDGNARPFGASVDAGAYERQS
jgi:chitodextrinase